MLAPCSVATSSWCSEYGHSTLFSRFQEGVRIGKDMWYVFDFLSMLDYYIFPYRYSVTPEAVARLIALRVAALHALNPHIVTDFNALSRRTEQSPVKRDLVVLDAFGGVRCPVLHFAIVVKMPCFVFRLAVTLYSLRPYAQGLSWQRIRPSNI